MPKEKKTEQEQLADAFQKSTGMKVVQSAEPEQGSTIFAKDTMKDVPVIPSGIEGK